MSITVQNNLPHHQQVIRVFYCSYLTGTLAIYLQQTPKYVCLARTDQFLIGATVLSKSSDTYNPAF